MVSALRITTLCYLLVASVGLALMRSAPVTAPPMDLVVDCLAGDLELPGRYTDGRPLVVRPTIIDARGFERRVCFRGTA